MGADPTVGMFLDPIADKLLISAALISLVQIQRVPGWMAVILIEHGLAVSGLRSITPSRGRLHQFGPSELGMTKMMDRVVTVSLVLLAGTWPVLEAPAYWALWGVMIFSLASAADYPSSSFITWTKAPRRAVELNSLSWSVSAPQSNPPNVRTAPHKLAELVNVWFTAAEERRTRPCETSPSEPCPSDPSAEIRRCICIRSGLRWPSPGALESAPRSSPCEVQGLHDVGSQPLPPSASLQPDVLGGLQNQVHCPRGIEPVLSAPPVPRNTGA